MALFNIPQIAESLLPRKKIVWFSDIEKEKLVECEKEVKVLEKHKEKALEAYKEEQKQIENKQLSEVAVQKYFQRTRQQKEEEGED